MSSPLLEVRGLNVLFLVHESTPRPPTSGRFATAAAARQTFAAVRDVSFSLAAGGVLGVVGESGSGKSVTSLAIMRLLPPQAQIGGQILFRPQNSSENSQDLLHVSNEEMRRIRGAQIGMIFQEPMTALNPVMRVGDQIAEAVLAHSTNSTESKQDAWRRAVSHAQTNGIPAPAMSSSLAYFDAYRSTDLPQNLTQAQRIRAGAGASMIGFCHTVPVNDSAGPRREAADPADLISMLPFLPAV